MYLIRIEVLNEPETNALELQESTFTGLPSCVCVCVCACVRACVHACVRAITTVTKKD